MASSSNSRDVRMTLSVDTLGEADIKKLQTTIANLAKEGGDAAPEFQKLADEIGRLGEQAQALQTFTNLTAQTAELRTRQEQASVSAQELRDKLTTLSAATATASQRQQAAANELNAARAAARATRDELATLSATTDRAAKSEDAYRAQVERLKVAKIAQRAEIERLSQVLAGANSEVRAAEQAESKLGSAYDRAATAAEKAAQALREHEAAVEKAGNAARELWVDTDNVAGAQAELTQALNRTGAAATQLQADINRLAEREREHQRLNAAAQWQREAEAIVEAAHAAQRLARETQILEAAQRELAAQDAFQRQAEAARQLQRAADYTRWWREEMERAERQARQTADEARLSGERISNAFRTLGVRSAAELRMEIANVRASMETMRTTAGLTGGALRNAMEAGEQRTRALERELRRLNGTLTTADRLSGAFSNSMGQISAGNLIADGVGYLINKIKELGVAFVTTIAQTDQTRKALMAVYKDARVAGEQFEFLRNTANEAGVSMMSIRQAFVRFSAATQASGIGLETTNALFKEVTRAAGTLGLSGDQVTGMLEALAQMASKGTVSMEELRQQLGDRLPGALSLVAKGLGLSEGALIKLVESGGLAARDLFPALTKALGEMRGETTGLVPSYERLKNALADTAIAAGDAGWSDLLIGSLRALAVVLGAILIPLTTVTEVVFGAVRALGILGGAAVTLTNPMEDLGALFTDAKERQAKLTETFYGAVAGVERSKDAHEAHNAVLAQAGVVAAEATEAVGTTARAQEAMAFATQLAADSNNDLSSSIVKLKAFIDTKLAAQEKEIDAANKLAKAAKIEGDSLVELAELRGNDYQVLESQVVATEKYANALGVAAEAQRAETELLTIKRDEIVKTALAQEGNTRARQQEIDAIERKIISSRAETEQSEQAAAAARQEILARRLAVQTYKDNSAAIGEYREAMESANLALSALQEAEANGFATKERVAEAARRAAEATRMYNDAVADSIRAIDLENRVREANNNLVITKLTLEQRNLESLAAAAKATGQHSLALHYEIEARRKSIEMIRLRSEAMRLEAEATIKALEIERASLDQSDPLLAAKQAEIDIRIANAKAKLLEANAGKDAIAALEREISLMQSSSSAREQDTSSRGSNTGAIYAQTRAMREQIQVMGEFRDAQDLAARGRQGDSVLTPDGTRIGKNAAGEMTSTGVAGGMTIAGEEVRLQNFLDGRGKINVADAAYIESVYETAMANLQLSQNNATWMGSDGLSSAYARAQEARRAYDALKRAQGGSGGAGLAADPRGTAAAADTGTTETATGTGTGSTIDPRIRYQKTVNISINGKSTPVNVATEADGEALTAVLRQLENAARTSA